LESSLQDELAFPLDQLLPPMNDSAPSDKSLLDPIVDPLTPNRPESIPRGREQRLDDVESAKPSTFDQTRRWIHQPPETATSAQRFSQRRIAQPLEASQDPAHRVAALPRIQEPPPQSKFVKQPD